VRWWASALVALVACRGSANHDFLDVSALRAAPVADMLASCQMPPDGAPPLAEAERRALASWAACAVSP